MVQIGTCAVCAGRVFTGSDEAGRFAAKHYTGLLDQRKECPGSWQALAVVTA